MPATRPSSIIVLGGPAAGKSVYLAALYHHLWSGHNGMTMRAGSGGMHAELLKSADEIQARNFPAATQALRRYEFELQHDNRAFHLHYLDYPGELFRRVFFDLTVDTDADRELLRYCEEAAGVIVLVDPRQAVEQSAELDYCLTNLMRFYESRKTKPPFVVAFTKRDENHALVGGHLAEFVRKHLPHFARCLGPGVHLLHFSSLVESEYVVQLARAETVKAPIQNILTALEDRELARQRARMRRGLAWRATLKRVAAVLALLIVLLAAFFLGATLRDAIDAQRQTETYQSEP